MAMAIAVNPAISELDAKRFLGGEPASGKTIIRVDPYNGWGFTNADAHSDMVELDNYLTNNPGTVGDPTYVLAHSRGSQVVYKWLREIGPTSPIATDTVVFVTTGCPEQKYTGASVLYPDESPAVYPGDPAHGGETWSEGSPTAPEHYGGEGIGYGLPATCPWTVYCVSFQYDGWSDAPNDPDNDEVSRIMELFSWLPLLVGEWPGPRLVWSHSKVSLMKSSSGPHGDYDEDGSPDLTDPDNVTYTDPANPTVTYVWIPTYPVTSLKKIAWLRSLTRQLDAERRPILEQAYTHRPVTIPAPDYEALGGSGSGWFL